MGESYAYHSHHINNKRVWKIRSHAFASSLRHSLEPYPQRETHDLNFDIVHITLSIANDQRHTRPRKINNRTIINLETILSNPISTIVNFNEPSQERETRSWCEINNRHRCKRHTMSVIWYVRRRYISKGRLVTTSILCRDFDVWTRNTDVFGFI